MDIVPKVVEGAVVTEVAKVAELVQHGVNYLFDREKSSLIFVVAQAKIDLSIVYIVCAQQTAVLGKILA